MDKQKRCRKSERGVALILALLAIVLLAVLAAGVTFTSQAQSWTALNYRQTAQSRYAAEAGIQSTMNWLSSASYPTPSVASYDMTKNPVQSGGNPVVLSANGAVSANYPDSTVANNYNTAMSKSLTGVPNASYSTYATLLRMNAGGGVSWLAGGGAGNVIQTWQITSQGSVGGLRKATVQVTQTFERTGTPIFTYGVAADGTSCPAVNFSGGSMDSWNSANGSYASTQQNSGGNIGTNGNVTLSGGSTVVHGTISDSSNITVGSCPDGITNNVGGTPWDGLQKLNQTLSYPTPTAPSTLTSNQNANSNTCWSGTPTGCTTTTASNTTCSGGTCTTTTGPAVQIAPGTYGNLTSNSNLHLSAGTYNFNSLSLNGGSITLDSTPVVINLGGVSISSGGTLFTANSSTTINDGGIPSNLQIVSACCLTGTPPAQMSNPPVITMNSSSSAYAAIYAPNAYVHITGSSHFLGAVVAQKVTSDSSGGFSYDVALANSLQQVGSFRPVGGFSWSKF